MNKNQASDGCTMGRTIPPQESIRNAEALIAKGQDDLARAKIKELNEKLQDVQLMRLALGCPPTAYILNGDGISLVRVSEDAIICGSEQVEIARRNENG